MTGERSENKQLKKEVSVSLVPPCMHSYADYPSSRLAHRITPLDKVRILLHPDPDHFKECFHVALAKYPLFVHTIKFPFPPMRL